VLGTPTREQWREGYRLAEKRNLDFNQYPKKILSKYLEGIGEDALDAVKLMLKISAQKRGSATAVLQLPFFTLSDLLTPSTQESK
jgi:male germ cell-associated kinase